MAKPSTLPSLFIADIFKSIQGEGPQLGTPSLFLRLGICNLQCSWCDTPYTWKKGLTDYTSQNFVSIVKSLRQLQKGTALHHLVITGGEPLLQQRQLALLLADPFFTTMTIEFETNGTQPLQPEFLKVVKNFGHRISFNISPKLADSGNRPIAVHFYPNSVLKFVYVSKKSEMLVDAFLKKNKTAAQKLPVYLMAEGTSRESMASKYPDMVGYCLKRGFRCMPRWHIELFGDTRAT